MVIWKKLVYSNDHDFSYIGSRLFIFQMLWCESWTELCEQSTEIQPLKALLKDGLISMSTLLERILAESSRRVKNIREFC